MSLSASVWTRAATGEERMSKRAFVLALTSWVAFGIALSAAGAAFSRDWGFSWPLLLSMIGMSVVGVIVANESDSWIFSLLGYLMIVTAFGLLTGPVVALYTTASVFKVLFVTCGMVVGLGVLGALRPGSLEHWSIWLFGALLILILGSFITIIAGAFGAQVQGAMHWIDWIAVALFSAFVIYDLNRAMRVPRTHANAIDCAVAIYLDFANLFLHLLSLFGAPVDRD